MAYSFIATSFPSLPSTFTPPSSCNDAPWTFVDVIQYSGGKPVPEATPTPTTLFRPYHGAAQLPTESLTATFDERACVPPGYYQGEGHYAGGVCPYGQTTATAFSTYGTSVALCCPTSFTVTDSNQGCVSTYTEPTTVNSFGILQHRAKTQTQVKQGATVSPGVLYQPAIVLIQDASSTAASTAAASLGNSDPAVAPLGATASLSTSRPVPSPSNSAVLGVVAAVVLAAIAALLLGFWLLRRRHPPETAASQQHVAARISNIFMIPSVVAVLTTIGTCLLAAERGWQEDLIRRFDSPNSVLRVIQVLSFVLRLCSTFLGWACVADIGWLLMTAGMESGQIVRVLDMAVTGGSYSTAWFATWAHLRSFSWRNTWILIFALALALAADLVGNAVIASTGVDSIAGLNVTASGSPFVQVGYVGVANSTLGDEDQVDALFSSAQYYPNILQLDDDTVAMLPLQSVQEIPSSYFGPSFFGSMTAECKPAKLNGSVFITNYDLSAATAQSSNRFGMEGFLELPFDDLPSPKNITFTKSGMTFTAASVSNPAPILAAWSVNQPNTDSGVQYIGTLLVKNATESFYTTDTKQSPTSDGDLVINDGSSPKKGQAAGTFSIQVCRLALPSGFGLVSAPRIQRSPLPPSPCSLPAGLCPNISTYAAGPNAHTTPWSTADTLQRVHASYLDVQTLAQALRPFAAGAIFCQSCAAPNGTAARILSSYVAAAAASAPDPRAPNAALAAALRTAALHAVALTYRAELPSLNGRGDATYARPQAATLVVNPAWVYATAAFVLLLIAAALLLRRLALRAVGADRAGSVLSGAALLASPSPFHALVRAGAPKDAAALQAEAASRFGRRRMRMGRLDGDRWGVGYAGDVRRRRDSAAGGGEDGAEPIFAEYFGKAEHGGTSGPRVREARDSPRLPSEGESPGLPPARESPAPGDGWRMPRVRASEALRSHAV